MPTAIAIRFVRAMYEFMKNYDVLIVPTFGGRQLAITNLTGNPVVCMPIGFGNNSGPVSITLIGKLYDEAEYLGRCQKLSRIRRNITNSILRNSCNKVIGTILNNDIP